MEIKEHTSFVVLFDTYGKLLSNKQHAVMDKYLNLDLSESELAELDSESRQSIHDAITKAKKQLLEFEDKCKVVSRNSELKNELETLKKFIKNGKSSDYLIQVVDDIKTRI